MKKKIMNHDLLWERIYHYVDYANLSDQDKQLVDASYLKIYQSLEHSHNRNEYYAPTRTNIFDYETTSTEDLRKNLGNWLIDNKLGLVFSNLFGGHVSFRCELMTLHAIKNKDITDIKSLGFFNQFENNLVADVYTGLHYGIHLSGQDNSGQVESQPITIGSRYFLRNKTLKQDRLTRQFDLDVMPYEYVEAKKDYEKMFNGTFED